MDLARKIGASCNTARRMKHKFIQIMMVCEDEKTLAVPDQADDAYLGGIRDGKRIRSAEGKTTFVTALGMTE